MAAHASSCDETATVISTKTFAKSVALCGCLLFPDLTASSSTVEDAVEVGGHDVSVVFETTFNHWALGPGYPCVGDKYV